MATPSLTDLFGPTALVTGASRGIGRAFAQRLAAEGFDLVLAARSETALRDVARSLEAEHGTTVRTVVADLAADGGADALVAALEDVDVDLLVSNAGAAAMGALHAVPLDRLRAMLRLNTEAHLVLVHRLGEAMLRRGRGGILLVGSTAGLQATPYGGSYAGAKAYVHAIAQALNYELRGTGVHAGVVIPGPTRTDALTARDDVDFSVLPSPVQEPAALVDDALRALRRDRPFVVGGLANRVNAAVGRKLLTTTTARNLWGALMTRATPAHLTVAGRASATSARAAA